VRGVGCVVAVLSFFFFGMLDFVCDCFCAWYLGVFLCGLSVFGLVVVVFVCRLVPG